MPEPIVYTIRGCDACVKLLKKWDSEGQKYDERRVELSQTLLDEARKFGDMVPIVVWPDGRVEQGFEGHLGCFI
jgi:glutaredoxin